MPSIKRYVVIPDLALRLNNNFVRTLVEEIKKATLYGYFEAYPSLDAAKKPKENWFSRRLSVAGIIEIEVQDESQLSKKALQEFCSDILLLPSEAEQEGKLSSLIKSIYIKGFSLPFDELKLEKREALQIASFNFNPHDESKLQLNQPPLLYLNQIPREILFLLFIDHQFFLNFENWRQYNAREPKGKGCVYDLFQGMTLLAGLWMTSSKTSPVTMDNIKLLHRVLSDSIYADSTEDRRGTFREGYNSFPLHADAVTVAGIKELLQRIKTDNLADGFRIGHFKRCFITSDFCFIMSTLIRNEVVGSLGADEYLALERLNKLNELKDKAIHEAVQKNKNVTEKQIELIINTFLQDFEPDKKVSNSRFWSNLSYYYSDLARIFTKSSPKAEFVYDLDHSRDHALASAGHVAPTTVNIHEFNDEELDNLARKIYSLIQSGEEIHLFPPTRVIAEAWAEKAVEQFNRTISQATYPETIIEIIDNLVHELEILHLFHDVNCRTNYLLMNFLFLTHSLKWATEFNPNRLDAYSSQERIEQHKQAIFRTDYIIANKKQWIKSNAQIELVYACARAGVQLLDYSEANLRHIQTDNQYLEISQSLVAVLHSFQKMLNDILSAKIKKYDLQPVISSELFGLPQEYIDFVNALKQFQIDYDVHHFLTTVAPLSEKPEIAEDIKSILHVAGCNQDWSQNNQYASRLNSVG
ncbi:hypothetical protein [Legionella hackeliae]|uniref:Fido domain-containing protein n=1 Tax=Legionella hackeliae TaxID=449 RepID=A0A0A8ULH1_LEGHA|nr:hypothetical protein [Legionella hackeliae]KTD10210.1 ankyrin repeat-containing protein [Legionella hackeliae]CEK09705.1 protein of unknown function [Legionella hackeliae]STX49615.1 ankyrin repeat-containing protein [Legionella hackeliae]